MATSMGTFTADVKELAHDITLVVRISRIDQWRWRLTIGRWLICLAALVMWTNIEFEEGE